MSLNRLPNELIYIIANNLDYVSNLNALAQTSRRFCHLLNDTLYGKNSWSIAGPALQWAAERGDVAKASRLLEHGAHPDLLTDEEVDGLQALAMLDERYAPKEFEKRPPLSTAALHGHLAVVNLLLEKGADPERHDLSTKWTPINWAIEGGHASVVQVLLVHGAKVTISSVNLAMEKGNVELVKILLEANPKLLQSESSYRTTLLTKAAEKKGNLEMLRFLVNQGLDPTLTDGLQFSPLCQAACSGDLDMVQYLLTQGFTTENLAQSLDGMRLWPVQWAAIAGHKNVVEFSLSVVNLKRSDYVSYLRILASAAAVGLEDTVQELISTGGFSGAKLDGITLPVHACFHPLDIAIQRGQTGVVRILLNNGADPTLGEHGRRNTPLFVAIKRGHLDVVRLLLDRGADLHRVEEYQDESLLAHAQPFPAIFKLLLDRGANVHHSAWNPGDLSIPMIAAMEGGNMAQVNMLRERGVQLEPQNSPHAKDSLLRAVQGGLPMMKLWAERYELPHGGRLEAEITNAAFHLAVSHGNHEVVEYFFELGYRLTMEDHNQLRITINRMKSLETFPETLEVLMNHGLELGRLSGCWIAMSDNTDDKLRVLRFLLDKGMDPLPASHWGHEILRWSIHCHMETFFVPVLLEAITAKGATVEEIHRNLLRVDADFSLRQSPVAVRLWRNFYWRSRYPVPA
ncbi:hypothetical protein N7478_006966 [Penicillium angulare]|uniref:uncharacterized protein n=1 Tax=Penicillium angulare TaxID=116970 RepID=UPI00254135D2|nr:uncharacterized protein N7478_006966 [Penicillium angulare]KAJ5281594.1 hypothetical protein N7478_006966 [Penicillium angulare]